MFTKPCFLFHLPFPIRTYHHHTRQRFNVKNFTSFRRSNCSTLNLFPKSSTLSTGSSTTPFSKGPSPLWISFSGFHSRTDYTSSFWSLYSHREVPSRSSLLDIFYSSLSITPSCESVCVGLCTTNILEIEDDSCPFSVTS